MKYAILKRDNFVIAVNENFNIWAAIFGIFYFLYEGLFLEAIGLFFIGLGLNQTIADSGILTGVTVMLWIIMGLIAPKSLIQKYTKQGYTVVDHVEASSKDAAIQLYVSRSEGDVNVVHG